jgi:hypothetical protein
VILQCYKHKIVEGRGLFNQLEIICPWGRSCIRPEKHPDPPAILSPIPEGFSTIGSKKTVSKSKRASPPSHFRKGWDEKVLPGFSLSPFFEFSFYLSTFLLVLWDSKRGGAGAELQRSGAKRHQDSRRFFCTSQRRIYTPLKPFGKSASVSTYRHLS